MVLNYHSLFANSNWSTALCSSVPHTQPTIISTSNNTVCLGSKTYNPCLKFVCLPFLCDSRFPQTTVYNANSTLRVTNSHHRMLTVNMYGIVSVSAKSEHFGWLNSKYASNLSLFQSSERHSPDLSFPELTATLLKSSSVLGSLLCVQKGQSIILFDRPSANISSSQ